MTIESTKRQNCKSIRDRVTREAFIRIDQLTLEKAIHFSRTSEQSRTQREKFEEDEDYRGNFIKKDRRLLG